MPRPAQSRRQPRQAPTDLVASALNLDPYSFKARFGDLIASTGVTIVPRALFFYSGELGLSYADVGFIGHILSYRWTTTIPFPSQGKLAHQSGITRRALRLRVMALKSLGYLRVVERFGEQGRQTSNGYDFTPLFARLNELIRRDWETVWKHRDPLVATEEDDPTTDGDISVDKSPAAEGSFPREGEQNFRGGAEDNFRAGRVRNFRPPEKEIIPGEESPELSATTSDTRSDRRRIPRTSNLRATTTSLSPVPSFSAPLSHDPGIDRAIADFSDQFDDRRHLAANQTRAHRLWSQTTLRPEEFRDVLYVAGGRTASHLDAIQSVETDGVHRRPKAMAYFFGVVKGVLRERGWTVEERSPSLSPVTLSVETLQNALGRRIRSTVADGWLAGARIREWDPEAKLLALEVPDPAGFEQLRGGYAPVLRRTVAELVGMDVKVQVIPMVDDPD